MNFENFVLVNFILTVGLAFLVYRQAVVYTFRRERETREIHQEIRNQSEYFNRRVDEVEAETWRHLNRIEDTVLDMKEQQSKKGTKGLNSRIPL